MKLLTSRYAPTEHFSQEELAVISRDIRAAWKPTPELEDSEVVLMPVDPAFVHVYWHVSKQDLEGAGVDGATHHGRYALEVTPVNEGCPQYDRAFTLTVQGQRNDRNIWLPPEVRSCYARLGVEAEDRFVPLAKSNIVKLPNPPVVPTDVLKPFGEPQPGLKPEPTLESLAKEVFPELPECALVSGIQGVGIARADLEELGVYYDEKMIDRVITEKLTRKYPGSSYHGILERAAQGDWSGSAFTESSVGSGWITESGSGAS